MTVLILRMENKRKKDWWLTDVKVEFDKLKAENPDIIGWIRFDDQDELGINYPILYSGDNKKYLRTDLYGNKHIAGSIFLEGKSVFYGLYREDRVSVSHFLL